MAAGVLEDEYMCASACVSVRVCPVKLMLPVPERTSGPMSNHPDWKTRSVASGGGDFWPKRAKVAPSEMICMRKADMTVSSSAEPSERRRQVGVLLHSAPSVKSETHLRRQLFLSTLTHPSRLGTSSSCSCFCDTQLS